MPKKRKAKKPVQSMLQPEYSSDESPNLSKKRNVKRLIDSDSDGEEKENCENVAVNDSVEVKGKTTPASSKKIVKRFLDSSDEDVENEIPREESTATPKADRLKRLRDMNKKVRAKKKIYSDSSEGSEAEETFDKENKPWLDVDDDDLPMWGHEEKPPEIEEVEEQNVNESDDDFIVPDDEVVEEDEEQEEEEVKSPPRKRSKKIRKMKQTSTGSDDEETTDEEGSYANPYMNKEVDQEADMKNILNVLSKNTEQDRKNAKNYKKEVGKYQFSVHSEKNKAALMSNKARFARNMGTAKSDKLFKEERNLDVQDSEYYEFIETSAYGESIRIFPHTKRVTSYKGKCSLSGCGESFEKGESLVVGVTKFCSVNFKFMKKQNQFGKESFYYVCAEHHPRSGSDSEQYSSGSD